MGERPLVVIPVKSFAGAKTRLAPSLDEGQRTRLGMALAARTALTAADAGAVVVIVADDDEVMTWADRAGFAAIEQPPGYAGLNGAAVAGLEAAVRGGRRPFVLHADLPWIEAPVLRRAFAHRGVVLAPSHDGGTALLGGVDRGFPVAYGRGSFHRHFATAPRATVVASPALALDLDQPADVTRALQSATGRWLLRYL